MAELLPSIGEVPKAVKAVANFFCRAIASAVTIIVAPIVEVPSVIAGDGDVITPDLKSIWTDGKYDMFEG